MTRFAQAGTYGRYHRYVAEVRPWLWFLTRTADCRIFQEMTVPDILKAVFADESTNDFKLELTHTYRKWTYCVQYRETDFNFVSRLMEHEGIYYYVRHTDGHNTLVLTDQHAGHAAAPGYEKIPFVTPQPAGAADLEHVSTWEFSREIQPGVYVHTDYDLERPSVDPEDAEGAAAHLRAEQLRGLRLPRHLPPEAARRGVRRRAHRRVRLAVRGRARRHQCPRPAVGPPFSLCDCPREDQNREHLVVSATHYAGIRRLRGAARAHRGQLSLQLRGDVQRAAVPAAAHHAQAVRAGTADRRGGGARGRRDLHRHVRPREGAVPLGPLRQEEPEQLVLDSRVVAVGRQGLGRRVHAAHRPGSDRRLPRGRSRSADHHRARLQRRAASRRSGSRRARCSAASSRRPHKGAGFNEMSLDDTAGKERVFIHGQYNMDTVVAARPDHARSRTTAPTWSTSTIRRRWAATRSSTSSRTRTSTSTSTGPKSSARTRRITVGGNRSITVNKSETATVALQRTHTVGVNETISVGGAQEVTVGGLQAITIGAVQTNNIGANQSTNVGANQSTKVAANQSTTVGGNQTTGVTGNRSVSVSGNQTVAVTGTPG